MTIDNSSARGDRTHLGAYRAFLIRCWQEPDAGNGCPAWRFTLVQLEDEQIQRGFASLEELTESLHEELKA